MLFRSPGSTAGGYAAVDFQAALELGLSRNPVPSGRGSIRLWFLQRDADIHGAGPYYYGVVQASQLVRLLPYGDHDSADLQSKKGKQVIAL